MVSKLYDPVGISSPLTLEPKLIVQEACRAKLTWDEPLPDDLSTRWAKWVADFPNLRNFVFPRCYKPPICGSIKNTQLHHFSDASDDGYGVASYIRFQDINDNIFCSFISGKCRVSPLKAFTIVQKELTACKVAVLQNVMLKKELKLKIDESFFWSDSQTVLKYIFNETTRFKTFVANRLAIIHSGSEINQWLYVPTDLNPADYASRGLSVTNFLTCKTWLFGPDFLCKEKCEWPQFNLNPHISNEDTNVKKCKINATLTKEDPFSKFLSHFSDWYKVKRGVMYLLLFIEYLKCKTSLTSWSPFNLISRHTYLSMAEKLIFINVQNECFQSELLFLKENRPVSKNSKLATLYPTQDIDGLVRVGGRLKNAVIAPEAKHSVILPHEHHISSLIVESIHRINGHAGKNQTIAMTRQKFWIIGIASLVKHILKYCVICKKIRGVSNKQLMADLPTDRVQANIPVFTNVGTDLFGPYEVKRGRSLEKRYGVVFTCLSSRAIHIEVAFALDTDSFINTLRRFIARRGHVKLIRSDNGTNLTGAHNELKKSISELNQMSIIKFCEVKGIEWIFNPPSASHFGGVWEIMIRSIRNILKGLLAEQNLKTCTKDDSLLTFMCEVEFIINNRPLTPNSDDINDLEALTPNHLLLLKNDSPLPPGIFQQKDLYVRKRWRQVQYLADLFWKRWSREYLSTLQNRQKWLTPKRNTKVGDLVLIIDENLPRNQWLLGRIIETTPDQDGYIRRVKLKTKLSILDRPIHKLVTVLEAV